MKRISVLCVIACICLPVSGCASVPQPPPVAPPYRPDLAAPGPKSLSGSDVVAAELVTDPEFEALRKFYPEGTVVFTSTTITTGSQFFDAPATKMLDLSSGSKTLDALQVGQEYLLQNGRRIIVREGGYEVLETQHLIRGCYLCLGHRLFFFLTKTAADLESYEKQYGLAFLLEHWSEIRGVFCQGIGFWPNSGCFEVDLGQRVNGLMRYGDANGLTVTLIDGDELKVVGQFQVAASLTSISILKGELRGESSNRR